MFLRKEQTGGVPGYEWPHDGAVLEVPDELAAVLLAMPTAGFSLAENPAEHESERPKRGRPRKTPIAEEAS